MEKRDDLISVEGTVEDIIYQNDENGYTVCVIDYEDEPLTVVGTMPSLLVGDNIRAMGKWTEHQTYGKQFKVTYFEKSMPADANSMLRYLSSRAIKGIGPATARRIVNTFKDETFSVIENNPEFLTEIRGITLKKAQRISEDFKSQFGVRNIMMFFGEFFGTATSVKIYNRFGNASVDIVKNNPYILCEEIYGIGFERADRMAAKLGLSSDSDERIKAGLKYVLQFNQSQNGHCYLPKSKLVETASALLGLDKDKIMKVLDFAICEASIVSINENGDSPCYLPDTFRAETYAADKLISLSKIDLYGSVEDVDKLIGKTEKEESIKYSPMQKKAIIGAIEEPVTVLTGGPGTGKTTIIKAIVNIFKLVGMEIALCAPTGRAAKRMSDATGFEAKTVHRLLEMEYKKDESLSFQRNENNPLDYDVVIVDELSMLDIFVFSSLLRSVRVGTRLIFIGDADQLPSVGAGEVLHDIIASECFSVHKLDRIFRQGNESLIVENAHRINNGEFPIQKGKEGDFFIISRPEANSALTTICDLVTRRLPQSYEDIGIEGIQVLGCTRKGLCGTENINTVLQNRINPPSPEKKEKKFRDTVFRTGDKIMQIRNNYDIEWHYEDDEESRGIGIFNGDIGYIIDIDTELEEITASFDKRIVHIDFEMLDNIELAYCTTVHKSQGSEFPIVIMPMLNIPPMLASRNLLYTGVTRAKKMVILVGSNAMIQKMIENNRVAERYTGLEASFRIFNSNRNGKKK